MGEGCRGKVLVVPYTCGWCVSHCHNCHNDSCRGNPSSNGCILHRWCRTALGDLCLDFYSGDMKLVCANIAEVEGCVLFRLCLEAFLPSPLLGGCEYPLLLGDCRTGCTGYTSQGGSEKEFDH